MTTQDVEAITPQTLINIRPVVAAIKEFFGTSQLSQFMDQVNPLSGLTHRRRLSALGPGGLSRERAGFEVRDVHFTHYGRMCPIETPEGPNIGLIGALATYARVNAVRLHRVAVPPRAQRQGHRRHHLAHGRRGGGLRRRPGQRAARRRSTRSRTSGSSCAGRRRPPPSRTCASSSSATPTSPPPPRSPRCRRPRSSSWTCRRSRSSRSAPRSSRSSSTTTPTGRSWAPTCRSRPCPLVRAEAPYIGTGIEARAARDAADMIIAEDDGVVTECSRRRHHRRLQDAGQEGLQAPEVRALEPGHAASTRSRCVAEGDTFKKGDILADGPSTDNGELALGKNLLVAFMPWEGYNFEDAIILSRAPGEGRRAHVDPHPRARDRRPRHQARPRGDHPGHPEPLRGDPQGPRRAGHHPRRRRGRPGRRARRQGHAQGRDRAHPRGAPPARHLR